MVPAHRTRSTLSVKWNNFLLRLLDDESIYFRTFSFVFTLTGRFQKPQLYFKSIK